MSEQIRTLEEEYAKLDSLLDSMCYQDEIGNDIDKVVWYDTMARMSEIQMKLAVLRHIPAETVAALDKLDAMNAELHALLDPFDADDSQPECEPEYDPADEWFQMTESMRRGE